MEGGHAGEAFGEAAPAVGHGLGAGLAIVAVPAAEARHDPREPGERALRPGVLLTPGRAFEPGADPSNGSRSRTARLLSLSMPAAE